MLDVIPAQAGTQWDAATPVEADSPHWVPAFAGMTTVGAPRRGHSGGAPSTAFGGPPPP
jgi:hypothetical protein